MKNKLFSVLVFLMLLIVGSGVILSCNQSLPSQYQVEVMILDAERVQERSENPAVSDDEMWVDYDEKNGSEKTTVFAGGKFARSIDSQVFTVRTSDQYWTFTFDGTTYSRDQLTYDMIEQGESQSTFDGRIDGSNVTLYAKYIVEKRERSALELLGTVRGTKYVNIPDDNPEEFELCLNGDYTFTEDPQYDLAYKVGAAIPDDWTFTRINNLHYTIASLDETRKLLKINVTGIPQTVETTIGEFVIPKQYISVKKGNQTENPVDDVIVDVSSASYIINTSSANANKTVEVAGNQYDNFTSSTREIIVSLENSATFDSDRITINEELNSADFTIYPQPKGLKFFYKELRSGNTELVIGVSGVPLEVSNSAISISFKEKFIKNSPEDVEDLVLVKTSGLRYNIGYVTIEASTTSQSTDEEGNIEYLINGVWEIKIPEEDAEVITLKITSDATFRNSSTSKYTGGQDVPDTWFNGTKIKGLSYKFGTFSDKEITIKVTSAPTYDSSVSVPSSLDLKIPVADVFSGVETDDTIITPSGTIRYNITRPSVSFSASSLGSRRYPLTIVKNVSLGGGKGVELNLQLSDGVEFESSLFTMASADLNSEIKTWFSEFETKLGSKDKFTYTVKNISSKDVVIKIDGVTSYSAVGSNESVNILVPARHIKNAGDALSTLNASLIYNTTSVNVSLSDEEGYYGSGIDGRAIHADITDDSLPDNTLVKVILSNAEFSDNLSRNNIAKWFSGFAAVSSNFTYEPIGTPGVDEYGNGYQIVKIIGNVDKITEASIGANTSYKLIISPDDIKGASITTWPSYDSDSDLQTNIYIKVEGEVSIDLEEGEFYGSRNKPLVGKKGVAMNNEQGYNIRINLKGGTFKGVTAPIVSTWFDAVSSVIKREGISIVEGGKDGDNYIIVNYKGSIQNITSANGRSARITVRKDNISTTGLSYDPTCDLNYRCEEEIGASIDNKRPYYGSELYPISGSRYMPLREGSGVEIRVVLNGTKFSTAVANKGLGDWFSDFKDIDTPTYEIVEGGRVGDDFVVISVKGALNTATTGLLSFTLKIDASKVKGADDLKNITATVYYTVSDEPRAVLVDEGTSYFGTENNPLSGINYTQFTQTIKLELLGGAKFSSVVKEGANIATWFKNFKEINNAKYVIATKTDTSLTVNVTGALFVDRSAHEGEDLYSATIEIPTTAVTGSLSDSLKTQIYYRTSGDVKITLDNSQLYVGSEDNPLVGTRNVSITTTPSGTGKRTILARFLVENGTFKNVLSSQVKEWFANFNDLKDASFKVLENEAGKDFITISIEGTLTTSSKTPIQVTLAIPGNQLQNYLGDGVITVPFYYNVTNDVTASFAEGGDYFGSVSSPFVDTQYTYSTKTLRIDLDGGVFSKELKSKDIEKWFEGLTEFKIYTDSQGSYSYTHILDGGKADTSYVVFTTRAVLSGDIGEVRNEYISIDKSFIKNATNDEAIRVPFYYGTDKEIIVTLDEGDYFVGATPSRAISGVPGQKLGNDGQGIKIRLNITNGYFGYNKIFMDKGPAERSDALANWFRDFENFEQINDGSADHPYPFTLDTQDLSAGTGVQTLTITLYGTLKSTNQNEGTFKIHVPSQLISGQLRSEIDVTAYYSISGGMQLNIDDRGESYGYFGTETTPLIGNNGIELANFDGSPLKVRINVTNGKFITSENVLQSDGSYSLEPIVGKNVDSWFTNLASNMANSSFTIDQVGTNQDYVVVSVKGALVSPSESVKDQVELTIPPSAFDGKYEDSDIPNPEITYAIAQEVKAYVVGYGVQTSPITRTIYQTFNDTENPTIVTIQLNYQAILFNGGESTVTFKEDIIPGKDVSSWFVNWISEGGISENTKFTIVEGGNGSDYVKVKIEDGALISAPPASGLPSPTTIVIPPSAIDGYLTKNIEIKDGLYYMSTSKITASISGGIEYSGGNSEDNPISETQNMMLGNGEGVLVRFELDDSSFKFKDNAGLLVNGPVTWLNSSEGITDKIKNLKVTLVSGGPGYSHAILRISGAITTPINEVQEATFTIPARQINNYLDYESDDGSTNSNVSGTLYFMATSAPSVIVDNTSPYKGGSSGNAIAGTRYISLGNGEGQEVYIKLTNAVFSDTLTDANVAVWFKALTDSMINPEVSIVQGGKKQSYVIVLLKGYLTQNVVSSSVSLTIPASDLYNNSSEKQLATPLYYRVNDEVSASLSGAPYFGTNESPITDIRGVEIQGGDGVLIRVELTSGVFKDTISEGKSVAGWFTSFTDLTNPSYEVIDGGSGKNYVVIRVKGIISDAITQGNANYSARVNIPADAIDGVLTTGPSLNIYYNVEDTVKVSLNTSNDYYGSVNNPIKGTRYIALNGGEGYNIRIDLTNGTFISTMDKDVQDWFKSFTDLIGDDDTVRSMQVIDGGANHNYVVINVKGALAVPVDGAGAASTVSITIPRSVIVGFLENDTNIDIYYASTNTVTLSVQSDEANGYFAGSTKNPLKGIQYVPLSYNTSVQDGDKIGRAVKLNLANAKFKDNANTRVGTSVKNTWFKDFNAMSDDATITIEAGGAGQSYAIIRIIGAFNLSREDDTCNIVIPKEDIDGVLSTELSAVFNYSCSGTLGVSLNVDNQFVGTTSNFLEAVKSTEFTHTKANQTLEGVLVRLDLVGSTFTGLTSSTNYEEWFKDLEDSGNFQKPNANKSSRATTEDGLSVTLEDGGNGKDYIVFNVKGAFKNEVPRITSNAIKIPSSNVIGSFKTDILTNFYYRTKSSVSASFDTSSSYYGSATNRVVGTNQILIGGTEGVLLKINIDGGVFGKEITVADLNGWFSANNTSSPTSILNGKIIKSTSDTTPFLSVIAGGKVGDDYVVVKLYGAFKRDTVTGSEIITIPSTVIQNMESNDNLEAVFNYVSNGNLTASIEGGSNLYGNSEDSPLETIIGYEFNNGSGYSIRIQLANGAVFKDMDEEAKKDLFDNLVDALDLEATNVAKYFKINEPTNGGAGFSYVEFKLDGVPGDNAIVDTDPDDATKKKAKRGSIKLSFKGSHINNFVEDTTYVDNNIEAELFYYNHPSSDVVVKFVDKNKDDNNSKFFGTQTNPIKAIPYTALGSTGDGVSVRMEVGFKEGVDSKLTLRFASTLNTDTITKWFESFEYRDDNPSGYGHFAYQVSAGGPSSTFVEVKVTGYPVSTGGYIQSAIETHLKNLQEIGGLRTATIDTIVYAKQLAPVRAEIMTSDPKGVADAEGRKQVSLTGFSADAPIVGPMRLSTSGMYVGIKLSGGDTSDDDYQPKFNGNVTNEMLENIFSGFIFPGYSTTLTCNALYGGDGFNYVIFEYNNSTPGTEVYETNASNKPQGMLANGPVYLPYTIIKNGVMEMDSNSDARGSIGGLYYMCIGSVTLSVITDAERIKISAETGVNIPLPIRRKAGALTEGAKTNTNTIFYNVANATGMTNEESASRFSGSGKNSTNPLRIINNIRMYNQDAELKFFDESTEEGMNSNDNTDLEDGVDLELYLTNTTFHTSLSDSNVQTWFNTLYDSNDGSGDNLIISLNKNIDYQTTGNKLEDQNLKGVYVFQNPDTHLYNTILYLKVTGYMEGSDAKAPRSFSVNVPYTYVGNGKNELLGTVSIPEFWYERVNPSFTFTETSGYYGSQKSPITGTQYVYLGGSYNTGVNVQGTFVNARLTKAGTTGIQKNFSDAFNSYANVPHPIDGDSTVPEYTSEDYEGSTKYTQYGTKGQLTNISSGIWYDDNGAYATDVVTLSNAQGANTRERITFTVKGAPRFRTFTGKQNNIRTVSSITIPASSLKGGVPNKTELTAELYWSIGRPEASEGNVLDSSLEYIFGFVRGDKTLTGNFSLYGNAKMTVNDEKIVYPYVTINGVEYRNPYSKFQISYRSNGSYRFLFSRCSYYGFVPSDPSDQNDAFTVNFLRYYTSLTYSTRSNAYVTLQNRFSINLDVVEGIVNSAIIKNKKLIGNQTFSEIVRRLDNAIEWTSISKAADGDGTLKANPDGVYWEHKNGGKDQIHFNTQRINASKFFDITGLDINNAYVFTGRENASKTNEKKFAYSFASAWISRETSISKSGAIMGSQSPYQTFRDRDKTPVKTMGYVNMTYESSRDRNYLNPSKGNYVSFINANTPIVNYGSGGTDFTITVKAQNHGDDIKGGYSLKLIMCSDEDSAFHWNKISEDGSYPITVFSDDESSVRNYYNFPSLEFLHESDYKDKDNNLKYSKANTASAYPDKGSNFKILEPWGTDRTKDSIYIPNPMGIKDSIHINWNIFNEALSLQGTPACFYVPYSKTYEVVDGEDKKIKHPNYL